MKNVVFVAPYFLEATERFLAAAVLTYLLMLVLKDPVMFPRIFLHAKEDLFYAPFACMLMALVAARLWASGKLGRGLALAGFAALSYLSIRDKAWNVDTLHPQPLAHRIETSSDGHGRRG